MALASIIIISAVSLLLSIVVAMLTLFVRGKLCMTQPMLVGFLYEGTEPKVFFRAMLYTTGKRGRIVEALYVKVRTAGAPRIFSFWAYGETNDLKIGSGLRVGDDGVSLNHHFLPPKNSMSFAFPSGEYVIDIYASIVNQRAPALLRQATLALSDEVAVALRDRTKGVLFTWQPDSQSYRGDLWEAACMGRDRSVSGAGGKLPWHFQ